jgi:hypothetical protein
MPWTVNKRRETMNCFFHPQLGAVTQCARPGCGRGLCPDCVFEDRCYEHAKLGVEIDYNIAHGRFARVWTFAVLGSIALAILVGLYMSENGASAFTAVLLLPVFFVGSWLFYMGMSWFYEKFRGRGIGVGGFVAGGGGSRNPVDMVWALVIWCLVVTFLFMIVSWIVMLVGLVTGIPKYNVDRKVIKLYESGWQQQMFPGKFNPETGQFIAGPEAAPAA